ncbi:hypothetical protein ACJMK2_006501 [Sinanodonta woodiana]|uniref:Methyltransferase domain-containing protein n=1 Tax=Sinanodonta woodiana TaxID=1069815 RepID=A0ABD3VUP0_SINWO
MLHTCWKRSRYIICFCVPVAMVIAGGFITFRETGKISTTMPSSKEILSPEYGNRSLCSLDHLTVTIPSDGELDNMTDNQLTDLYWSYINTIQVLCRKIVRIGKIEDGGKEVCTDVPFHPRPPCIVYSFGINYQWDFDEDAARIFGCEVFSFDPSMRNKGETYKYADNITFYMIGLEAKNTVLRKHWKMKTLEQIRQYLNHTERTISILKLDIEGSEWTSIPQMVSSGTLRSVNQMQIELHGKGTKHTLKVLRMLYNDGFRLFMRERNLSCKYSKAGLVRARTSCMEVSMIRVSFPLTKCD